MRPLLAVLLVACSSPGPGRDDAASVSPPSPARGSAKPAAPPPRVHVATPSGEVTVAVEVVATPAKIARGLMYREHLAPDAGMLFLMERAHDWAFYMRNTLIPLDMLFLADAADGSGAKEVVGIVENAEPRTEDLRQVGVPSSYVLEVNGGWSAKHQVKPGARVRFEHVPARP